MTYNFFLTDLMKTGNHQLLEKFISLNNIPEQHIDYTGEYYTLHTFDLKKYKRKFALIDHASANSRLWNNTDYWKDLSARIKYLGEQGFVFLIVSPWESLSTFDQSIDYNNVLKEQRYSKWIGKDSWFWTMMYNKFKNTNFNFDHSNKKYDFLYLNKFPRLHRVKLFNNLKKNNILENSLVSFLGLEEPVTLSKEYELPWVDYKFYPRYGHDSDMYEKPYNHSKINIVSETTIDDEEVFLTEKIWKPIIAQQIFVVHGRQNYLKNLRELGFKTFNGIIDESYDEEGDPEKRINKIVDLCKWLKTQDWKVLYEKTKDIREHNAYYFFKKEALQKVINKTLLGFLEFADRS